MSKLGVRYHHSPTEASQLSPIPYHRDPPCHQELVELDVDQGCATDQCSGPTDVGSRRSIATLPAFDRLSILRGR